VCEFAEKKSMEMKLERGWKIYTQKIGLINIAMHSFTHALDGVYVRWHRELLHVMKTIILIIYLRQIVVSTAGAFLCKFQAKFKLL
jgi:hypothetical protein